MLGVPLSTVQRRMREYGLSIRQTYSQISKVELNRLVHDCISEFPNAGYGMVGGWLRHNGYRVQEARVRASVREVDPVGVANRWLRSINRRVYNVASPQALWHLDGNHKLIRWKFVVHAAVDGFSRLPVYLHCSNNNCATTVLHLFNEAVETYGLPARIRCDQGVENYDAAMCMLMHPRRGPQVKPVIVGKSVHNQIIERLWRDVYIGVISTYYHLFHHLERMGLLDVTSDVHLFCLQYVYLPVINNHLEQWRQTWIHHKMSSCGGKSPMQLWIEGLQHVAESSLTVAREIFDIDSTYGIDYQGPVPVDPGEDGVIIPPVTCPLSDDDYRLLLETIPLSMCNVDYNNYRLLQ